MREMIRDGVARRLLTATFASIVALIVVFEAVDYLQSTQTQERIQHTTADALHSVELVGRIGIDVEHEHVLLGRHISNPSPQGSRGSRSSWTRREATSRTPRASTRRSRYSPASRATGTTCYRTSR